MNIGVISLPLNSNYGGILQAYALQKTLIALGCNPKLIEIENIVKESFASKLKKIAKILLGMPKEQNTKFFIDRNIQINKYKSFNSISPSEYDALIAGSDQVWRKMYFPEITQAYFEFASKWNDIIRLSYAASFGIDRLDYSPNELEECKKLVLFFKGVSVREESGVKVCKESFGVDASLVLDPTMLLSKNDYMRIAKPKHKNILLYYVLNNNPEIARIIDFTRKELALTAKSLNGRPIYQRWNPFLYVRPTVEEWLGSFADADFIVTDSFHAVVFSIVFNKPFAVIGNKERGMARFESLLGLFDLQERLISNLDEYHKLGTIDWDTVNSRLSELKIKSVNFLRNSLGL